MICFSETLGCLWTTSCFDPKDLILNCCENLKSNIITLINTPCHMLKQVIVKLFVLNIWIFIAWKWPIWNLFVNFWRRTIVIANYCLSIGENHKSVGGRRLSCTGASLSATWIKGRWRNDFPSYIACVSTLFIHALSEHCNELNLQFTPKTVTLIKIKWFHSKELLGALEMLQNALNPSACLYSWKTLKPPERFPLNSVFKHFKKFVRLFQLSFRLE